ncbi:hypothetical protein E3J84_07230 [Candidatus Aerophobetes bacterium]|uniref:Transposase n=1 Tax=Aerophobetes bacterium TaxID=2030807 RepID=A0A523RPC0_UNCAE|nr:MAG: hypothetical protein E3J84_07230 [Candidatus Aerophobetes bacterium]
MKDFKSIFIKKKILIVCQVIAGGKIQRVAKKHGVSRASAYAWTEESFRYPGASTKTGETRI